MITKIIAFDESGKATEIVTNATLSAIKEAFGRKSEAEEKLKSKIPYAYKIFKKAGKLGTLCRNIETISKKTGETIEQVIDALEVVISVSPVVAEKYFLSVLRGY